MRHFLIPAALLAVLSPAVTRAEVLHAARDGFEITVTTDVAATPARAWAVLVEPARWWDSVHSWSGDSHNLTLDPRSGGYFHGDATTLAPVVDSVLAAQVARWRAATEQSSAR